MYDALSFTEIDGQHVELLPARTVLSMFSLSDDGVIYVASCENAMGQAAGLLSTGGGFASNGCQPGLVVTGR
jgi:hypothetical protein